MNRSIFITLAGIAVLMAPLSIAAPARADERSPTIPAAPEIQSPVLPADPNESQFKPDVYPTPRAAMAALAQDVVATISQMPAIADPHTQIIIRGTRSTGLGGLGDAAMEMLAAQRMRELADALNTSFPQLGVDVRTDARAP